MDEGMDMELEFSRDEISDAEYREILGIEERVDDGAEKDDAGELSDAEGDGTGDGDDEGSRDLRKEKKKGRSARSESSGGDGREDVERTTAGGGKGAVTEMAAGGSEDSSRALGMTEEMPGMTEKVLGMTEEPFGRAEEATERTEKAFGRNERSLGMTDGAEGAIGEKVQRDECVGAVSEMPAGGSEDSSSLPVVASLGMTEETLGVTEEVPERTEEAFGRTGERVQRDGSVGAVPEMPVGGREDSSRALGMTEKALGMTGEVPERAEEMRGSDEEAPHVFYRSIDAVSSAAYAGQLIVEETKQNIRQGDRNYAEGRKELRRFSVPLMETVAMMGVVAQASAIRDDMADAFNAFKAVNKKIDAGMIGVDDLSLPKGELKKRLKDADVNGIHNVARHADVVADLYTLHDKLKEMEGALHPDIKTLLEDEASFDLRSEKTNQLIKAVFPHSKNDVVRNAGVSGMKARDLERLLKRDKKGRSAGLSELDGAALRLLIRQKRMREVRQKVNVIRKLKRYAFLATRRMVEADENMVAGLSAAQRTVIISVGTYSLARAGVRAGVFAHRVWTTYGIVGRYVGKGERFLIRKAADGSRLVLVKTAEGIKAAKSGVKNAVNNTRQVKAAKEAVKRAKGAVSQTEAAKIIKEAQGAARKIQTELSLKQAMMKRAAMKIRDGTRVVFTPFRIVKKVFGKIYEVFHGLYRLLLAAVFGVIIIYAAVVILLTGILSVFTVEGNAVMNIILCNDDGYVPGTIAMLQGLFEEEKEEALETATGKPKNPGVFHGHTISRYGAPQKDDSWSDGYKIYYRDLDGNIIENGVNNIKDVIVLAYVMMDGDFDTDAAARDALIRDVWSALNPGVSWEETDIYTAEAGDDSFHYSCDSPADYEEMREMRSEGVRFFGSVRSYSGDGCAGDEDDRYCAGHEVDVCYGHKDIKVYITVGFMEDFFQEGGGNLFRLLDGEEYRKYLEAFRERGGFTEEAREWANALYANSWFDLYGCDPGGGAGYAVADLMSPEEIAALTEQYGSIDGTRTEISSFALTMVGRIPYYWGGKPVSGDYDENHFYSAVKSDGSQYSRTKRGLDCSGFVAFVYWHVLGHPIGASSTGDFTNGRYRKISAAELTPGDVGLLRTGYSQGSSVNHIGIFVGRDAGGNAVWVHCTGGSTGNVVCGGYNFSVYYSVLQ